jgi:hypothetical protein
MSYLKKTVRVLLISAIFAVAMAYLESTVVVYLRKIYYPDGFHFPLADIPRSILFIEAGREVATIIMLYSLARLVAAGDRREVMAYFCFTFGIWDIGYYVWLKILLNWPGSWLDWDVLFLIPLPWLGPVLAPILVSMVLIATALIILYYESMGHPLRLTHREKFAEIAAGLLIIITFFSELHTILSAQIPQNYPWWLFAIGMALGLTVFIRRVYLHFVEQLESTSG